MKQEFEKIDLNTLVKLLIYSSPYACWFSNDYIQDKISSHYVRKAKRMIKQRDKMIKIRDEINVFNNTQS